MAGVSDDDVPTESPAEDLRRGKDGDATSSREARDVAFEPLSGAHDDDEEEDRTVRSTRLQPQSLRKPELPPPTSRKLTAVGLGAPPPATRPAAGYEPSRVQPEPVTASPDTEADEIDESVTAQAPAPRVSARVPLPIEGSVSIRTLEDDESDETEVRTMPGASEGPPLLSRREARSSAIPTPRMPGAFEASDDDPTHERAAEVVYAEDDDEDSVTTRGPAIDTLFKDDSVTASRGPVVRGPSSFGGASSEDDGTGGTTHKVRERSALPRAPIPAAGSPASPADEEKESITTQAPGHVTNMLRVIAAGSSDEIDTLDTLGTIEDDEPPQNKTAVMPNAPVKPDGRTTRPLENGRAVAALQLTPSSESGLRVARPGSNSGERASLRALGATEPYAPGAAAVRAEAFGPDVGAMFPPGVPGGLAPPDAEPESKPRYGLVVGIVAVLSFVIPLALFFYLRQGHRPSLEARPSAEPAADLVQRADDVRPKANKGARSAPSSSAEPSSAPAIRKR